MTASVVARGVVVLRAVVRFVVVLCVVVVFSVVGGGASVEEVGGTSVEEVGGASAHLLKRNLSYKKLHHFNLQCDSFKKSSKWGIVLSKV